MLSLTLQDALVTLAAVAALAVLVRPFLPRRLGGPRRAPDGSPCASCASGTAARTRNRRS
jgi:hypothetical protein